MCVVIRQARVRSGTGLGFLSPPAPRGLCRPTPLVPCKVQSPPLGRRKPALFYVRVFVMPALVAGIHVFNGNSGSKDVDGRDKPGHDDSVLRKREITACW